MRRLTWGILILLGLLGGCAAQHPCPIQVEMPAIDRTVALFDRFPGDPTASAMAWRSDWPAVFSRYQAPEQVSYREIIRDFQGLGTRPFPQVIRRFESYRSGAAIR